MPWRCVWPGALGATFAIGVLDYAFPLYLQNVSTLRVGTTFVFIVIALVWFYALAIILLAGAVVNELRFERPSLVCVAVSAIETVGLTKRYGAVTAVDDLSFSVREGAVTGFLGPNGAGKTTTLRMILALARPTRRPRDGARPARTRSSTTRRAPSGRTSRSRARIPGRNGRDHLRALAAMAGLPRSRVDEVLRLVELDDAADRRAGKYSLGMRQRLGLAATLLGDPQVLVLDEPANGLDPQGIRWLRDFLRGMAAEGRTVLVSSHVLAEVAQTVDDVVVIHRGRLVDQGPVVAADRGRARARAHAAGRTSCAPRSSGRPGRERSTATSWSSTPRTPRGSATSRSAPACRCTS